METERERKGCRGSGAEGWSSGAKSSKIKSEQKRNRESKEGLIPLNSWAQLLTGRQDDPRYRGGSGAQAVVWRCDTVRLLPTPEQEELLQRVGDAAAKLINMENYRRRQLFFEGKGIDYSWKSAWKRRETEYVEIYRVLGSANFHEACRAVSEMWKSFVELLKAKKRGRLEPWQQVHPPGYRKREGQRTPTILVRFDNYKVDLQKKVLRLGYWNVELRFSGKPKWLAMPGAKQGRLTITYDPVKCRWYARVSTRVKLERERDSGLKAGIDLGREILAAVAVENDHALLYRGGVMKSDYFYFEKRIAEIDKTMSDPRSEEVDRAVLRAERRRL